MRIDQTIEIQPDSKFMLSYVPGVLFFEHYPRHSTSTITMIEGREDQIDAVLQAIKKAYLDELEHQEYLLAPDSEIDEARRQDASEEVAI